MEEKKTSESGLQRYTGIKKYGKKGFEELQKAGREGASEEEKGAIKDKYLKKKTNEGLGELADMAERDHEVQMARAELYKLAKYSIKLHDMLKQITEAEGLEGWQQAKITKAADYISSVYHSLEYDTKFNSRQVAEAKLKKAAKDKAKKESLDTLEASLKARLAEKKAVSKVQQQAAGIALAAKRKGKKPAGKGAAASMAKMPAKELEKFAGTKHKGLPKKKD